MLVGSPGYTLGRSGPIPDWDSAVGRVFAGIKLLRADRADRLVFSSGDYFLDDLSTEGELARELVVGVAVDASQIIFSGRASNTADEARLIRPLIGKARRSIIFGDLGEPHAARCSDICGRRFCGHPVLGRYRYAALAALA